MDSTMSDGFKNANPVWYMTGPAVLGTTTFSNVTIAISPTEEEAVVEGEATVSQWEGILGIEGHVTGDRRYLMPGGIDERDLPLTLMVQTVNEEGHKGSEVGGRIDAVTRITPEEARSQGYMLDDVPDDAVVILAQGIFDNSEFGSESARMVNDQVLRGISVDLATTEIIPLDPESLEPLDIENMDIMDLLMGNFVQGIKGNIMGATVVPFAAFEEAVIRTLTASGTPGVLSYFSPYGIKLTKASALTASAAPLKPPTEWFQNPNFMKLTPLTITKDGRIFGHLADWSGCHTGSSGVCVPPPRSASDYAYFNVGEIETADGELVPCGKIMFSMDGGKHAPTDRYMSAAEVAKHYDDTTCVGAYVRAGSDRHGTWLAGALRPNMSEEEIQHLRTHPPSGDWRPVQNTTELVAAFSVPIPGFPIPRAEAYLVASAGSLEVTALITPPISELDAEEAGWRRRKRKKVMLKSRITEVLGVRPTPRARIRQAAMVERDAGQDSASSSAS